jgi:hypothetical protein
MLFIKALKDVTAALSKGRSYYTEPVGVVGAIDPTLTPEFRPALLGDVFCNFLKELPL